MNLIRRLIRAESELGSAHASDITVTVAADFLHGGPPAFARIFDRRGSLLDATERLKDEPWAGFLPRAKSMAGEIAGATTLFIGGLPPEETVRSAIGGDIGDMGGMPLFTPNDLPRGAIVLSEAALHPSQRQALGLIRKHRRVGLVCGRRWGKSSLLTTLAVDAALSGKRVGMFAPTRTLMSPLLMEIAHALQAVPGVSINRVLGEIRLPSGGHVDFWSVDHSQRAGRGRKYHLCLLDESAHDEGYLTDAFPAAIAPTTLDYAGSIVEASTPNGVDPDNHFWQIAHMAELGFVVHCAPTSANPHLPVEEIAALRATLRPEIASQELDGLFVDLGGATIFPIANSTDRRRAASRRLRLPDDRAGDRLQ